MQDLNIFVMLPYNEHHTEITLLAFLIFGKFFVVMNHDEY